jgi:MinD-like ATPase involved in chromosome partitioning or flagellar assembly
MADGALVDGRRARRGALARIRRRGQRLRVSRAERDEAEIEQRLRAHPGVTRANLIAVMSPRGGVGKTALAFALGNLLATHLKLRVIAVDASPEFGTLNQLVPPGRRADKGIDDLVKDADRLFTAAELRPYVSRLATGAHVLAPGRGVGPDGYGELVALLSCFYETIVLDLGPGVTGPLARFARDRSDQVLLVTTPEEIAARHAIDAARDHDGGRTTVIVNRTHPRLEPELRAIEECLRQSGLDRSHTLPDDRRLALMLDTGTYTLEALARPTRVSVKRLGVAVAEQLV